MEGNDCNKAIKIVTVLAIILFIFGASTIMERNQLQKENAQLNTGVNCASYNFPAVCVITIDLTKDDYSEVILKYRNTSRPNVQFLIDNNNEITIKDIPKEKEEKGLRISRNILPVSNNQPAPSENTSIAKPINFSFRQELERMINTQYAPTTLQFKEIVCDFPYDENCYVKYDIGTGGYWITVPKKYADEW